MEPTGNERQRDQSAPFCLPVMTIYGSRMTEAGQGSVQEKARALLLEIIEKVNTLFDGELTEEDKLVYVNNVIKGKLLEAETLQQQASNNTKEQFATSPDLDSAILNAREMRRSNRASRRVARESREPLDASRYWTV